MRQHGPHISHDGFRVKLHPFHIQGLMTDPHQLTLIRMGRGLKAIRQGGFLNHQGMIAHPGKGIIQSEEHPAIIVMHGTGFTVHHSARPDHLAAECLADGLMTETDPEDRDFTAEILNSLNRDPGLLRRTGTGGRSTGDQVPCRRSPAR